MAVKTRKTVSTTAIAKPETATTTSTSRFTQRGTALIQRAQAIIVRDPTTFAQAVEFGRGVSGLIDEITDFFKPLKRKAKEAHTALCDSEKQALANPARAQEIVDDAIRDYRMEQSRLAKLEEDRVRAELEAQAAADRARQAAELKRAGDAAAAKATLSAPLAIPRVQVTTDTPRIAGTRVRTKWHFKIEDATKLPRIFTQPDESLIRSHVNQWKDATLKGGECEIPGVKTWSTEETDY